MLTDAELHGSGCRITGTSEVPHLIIISLPDVTESFSLQVQQALEYIRAYALKVCNRFTVVQQTIFMKDISRREECHQLMREWYADEMPVNVYVSQSPCSGQHLAIEALVISLDSSDVEVCRYSEQLITSSHEGCTWIYCGQIRPETTKCSVYERSVDAFHRLRRTFEDVNIPFTSVLRTWLYLGDIVGREVSVTEGETQRYKELNRARSDFFRGMKFYDGMLPKTFYGVPYPASTGIGMTERDVLMSGLAIKSDSDLVVVPLENPQQVSAFEYTSEYSPRSPKFARAMAVSHHGKGTIFVSGTASITDAESRYEDDAVAQVELTLDNIEMLISEDNLCRHGIPGLGCALDNLAVARVYVKRIEDYPAIRSVCQKRMAHVPTLFTVADVCRPELLVEIEGIAFTSIRP